MAPRVEHRPAIRLAPRQAGLLVNVRSRQGEDALADARARLTAAGIEILEARAVRDPDELPAAARDMVARGVPMLIVGGGDGSLSSTVDELVGHDCVFAVLPLGTANSFARGLGMPLDLDGAARAIAGGHRKRIDLGRVNGDYFANAAALGLSPMIGETIPHGLKRRLGRLGYLVWAVWCLLRFSPFRLTIDDGNTIHRLWASEVRIFNGGFHGGIQLLDAPIDDGLIVVQAVTGRSLLRLVWDWLARMLRLPGQHFTTQVFEGARLTLDTRPHLPISIDGEVVAQTPAVIECAHKAIDVVVPAEA